MTTVRGTVLYLCLEDSLSRIQGRLFQLTENAPAALHFATMAGNIGKGLEEQIEGFLQMYRDTVLVVIDTLQKVRVSNSAANPYANDYQDLSSLKALGGTGIGSPSWPSTISARCRMTIPSTGSPVPQVSAE